MFWDQCQLVTVNVIVLDDGDLFVEIRDLDYDDDDHGLNECEDVDDDDECKKEVVAAGVGAYLLVWSLKTVFEGVEPPLLVELHSEDVLIE